MAGRKPTPKKQLAENSEQEAAQKAPLVLTLDHLQSKFNTKYGAGTLTYSAPGIVVDTFRIPSGVFAVDYCSGGGFPLWRSCSLWGPPSAGKTTLALFAALGVSRMCFRCHNYAFLCTCSEPPIRMKSVLVDVEGTHDSEWASNIGLNSKSLIHALPETGESAVDMAENVLKATDCGLVIVDSLAMIEPSAELEAASEDQFIGLQARLVAKMFRKVTSRIISERKQGHPVTAIFLNQVRSKIGGHGNGPSEEQPTGYSGKFAYSLAMRIGSRRIDPSKEPDKYDKGTGLPLVARTSLTVTKHKLLTLSVGAEYDIVKGRSYAEQAQGTVLDLNTTLSHAQQMGLLYQEGSSKWVFQATAKSAKKVFSRKRDFIESLKNSPKGVLALKQILITKAKEAELAYLRSLKEVNKSVHDAEDVLEAEIS
jgi:recombination protein RecA